jgi:glucose-6-phosphate isomerase
VDRHGNPLTYHSGPVLWGEPGTNGQHAFYQLIHQGTVRVPCDFILAANTHYPGGPHHRYLSANAFAQAQALMQGRSLDEVRAVSGGPSNPAEAYQVFEGNRPSNFLLCQRLTPAALGALVAMYEHKIWVQGVVWNVFSYDQWGVELGKILAGRVLPLLEEEQQGDVPGVDSSTKALVARWQRWQDGREKPKGT